MDMSQIKTKTKPIRNNIILVFAIICIISSVAFVVLSFVCQCQLDNNYVGISTTFATLAGAILVFSTLDLQRKALTEEKLKNKSERFDSQFYPTLSSFRMDAANMEIKRDYIVKRGKGLGQETWKNFNGDFAFKIANQIVETLYDGIVQESIISYNAENVMMELEQMNDAETYLCENCAPDDEIDRLCNKRTSYLDSQQTPYLLYRYGITNEIRQQYKNEEVDIVKSFILDKLFDVQPTIFAKYIQSLRFILHKIDGLPKEIEKRDYYLSVSCRFSKEEMDFLRHFKEFNNVSLIE